jgi:predicted nucleic acid-binding protein
LDYADSSFLVSCYVPDANMHRARLYLEASGSTFSLTPLHRLEFETALELGIFRELFTSEQCAAARRNFEADLAEKRLVETRVQWARVFRLAERLSKLHCRSTGVRSLDLLHVATALASKAKRFASFDIRQRKLADAAGLVVVP